MKGKRREVALLAVAALLLALVLLGGPPALAEEGGWDLEAGLAAVSLPSALDDFAVAHSDLVPSGAEADGQPEEADAVTAGLPAMGAVTNPRFTEEETEALQSAASTGGDRPSSLAPVENQSESCDDTSLAASIEPLGDSPLADHHLDVTPEVAVDHEAAPPASPPSTSSDDTQPEEPQPPSSLGQQPTGPEAGEGAPEPGPQEPPILAITDVSGEDSRAAAVIAESDCDQPSLLGRAPDLPDQVEAVPREEANLGQDDDQLAATPEEAESPSPLPSASGRSTEEVAAEQVPADGEADATGLAALDHLAAKALHESVTSTTEVDVNEEEVEVSSLDRASEAAEGHHIVDTAGEIGGEADGDYETEGEAEPDGIAGTDLAECEEAAELESEEAISSASDQRSVAPTKSPPERPNESEARQGEGVTPNLDEVAEKEQPTASGGELVTPQEEVDDEGKEKRQKQETLMARKKRLREQAGNQTEEEEEQAREVVRRKLESLHQRDQAKRPSEQLLTNATSVPQGDLTKNRTATVNNGSARVPGGGGAKPTAARPATVDRASDGVKAPARVAGADAEKLATLKQAPETRSPAVAVALPSAGTGAAATGKNSPTTSSSPPPVVSPSHPAPGLPKASPTRLDPPSYLAGEARSGQRPSDAGLRGVENTEAKADSPSAEGEVDLEDEYEDYWDNEVDGLLDGDDYGDELPALVVGSAPQQKSQLAKDQAEAEAHAKAGTPNDSADKARKLAERKILLKMAKEASGISHSEDEDAEMKAWKRRAKLKNMETKRKQDVPAYDIASVAARRRELDRIKKEKLKNKGSLRYKKAV